MEVFTFSRPNARLGHQPCKSRTLAGQYIFIILSFPLALTLLVEKASVGFVDSPNKRLKNLWRFLIKDKQSLTKTLVKLNNKMVEFAHDFACAAASFRAEKTGDLSVVPPCKLLGNPQLRLATRVHLV